MENDSAANEQGSAYLPVLKEAFGERVWFCGVQGGRARVSSAQETPPDIVVILDELGSQDIAAYRKAIESVPRTTFACGFLAGKRELMSWEPAELFHFCNNTTPLIGSLDEVAGLTDKKVAVRALWTGVTGIYKSTVRNMVYERSPQVLLALFDSALLVMSALYFLRTGKYRRTVQELSDIVEGEDRDILDMYDSLRADDETEFDAASGTLFEWARDLLLLFPDGESEPDVVAASRDRNGMNGIE